MQATQQQALVQLSRAEQSRLNLPEGWKTIGPQPFGGLDQKNSRWFIQDNDFYWIENLFKLGNGLLRPVYDVGAAIYTAPTGKTIQSFFFYTTNLTAYVAVFHTDGTANQVNLANQDITTISSAPGTFFKAGAAQPPGCAQWGAQYLLIANNFGENTYWAWDGSLLYYAGTIAPDISLSSGGQNYSSTPSVSIAGGQGGAISLSPIINGGSVVALQINDPGGGYLPGDTPQVYFSGGGSDTSAELGAFLFATGLASIVVQDGGSGYAGGTTVVITPSGGAAATPTIVNGVITEISVTAAGSGFTGAPSISFANTGGGTGAAATANLLARGINTITVVNGGTNYTGIPKLTIVGNGQIQAVANPIMSGPGPLMGISVTYSGNGYSFVPSVTISDPTGSGAVALAEVSGGAITQIVVVDPGAGYTNPTITVQAPTGTGSTQATAAGAIGGGSIASVAITNPGGGYTRQPAVIVEPTNNAAAATLGLMPFGVSGSAIENYTNRVFLVAPFSPGPQSNAGSFLVSAPESMSDFSTAAGGVLQVTTDATLRQTFVNLKQSTGNLYFLGDSSTSVLSNVNTTAGSSGTVTTYTYQNMDPQIGAQWRDSFQPFSRTILFANPLGVWGLYGGADTKVSEKIDNLFAASGTSNPVTPTSAVATLFSQRVYLLNKTIIDPRTGIERTVLLGWNEHDWFVFSQSKSLIYIGTQEQNTMMTAYGTDGTTLFPLFANASGTLTKSWSSKLYGMQTVYVTKQARAWLAMLSDLTGNGIPAQWTVDTEFSRTPIINPLDSSETFLLTNPYPNAALALGPSGDVYAGTLGLSFTTAAADFEMYSALLGYTDYTAAVGNM